MWNVAEGLERKKNLTSGNRGPIWEGPICEYKTKGVIIECMEHIKQGGWTYSVVKNWQIRHCGHHGVMAERIRAEHTRILILSKRYVGGQIGCSSSVSKELNLIPSKKWSEM